MDFRTPEREHMLGTSPWEYNKRKLMKYPNVDMANVLSILRQIPQHIPGFRESRVVDALVITQKKIAEAKEFDAVAWGLCCGTLVHWVNKGLIPLVIP